MKKILPALFLSTILVAPAYAQKPTTEQVRSFAQELSGKVIDVLKTSGNDVKAKKTAFADIFKTYGDVPQIAQFVAGKAWRNADDTAKQNYVNTYRDYMAFTYAQRINGYDNQTVNIGRIVDLGNNGFIVHTSVNSNDGQKPLAVTWQLNDKEGSLKVTDLRIENISMALTQKAEFEAILMKNNHNLSALSDTLKGRM